MKRPSPHDGSSSRSEGWRIAHVTSAEAASGGVKYAPVSFRRALGGSVEGTRSLAEGAEAVGSCYSQDGRLTTLEAPSGCSGMRAGMPASVCPEGKEGHVRVQGQRWPRICARLGAGRPLV